MFRLGGAIDVVGGGLDVLWRVSPLCLINPLVETTVLAVGSFTCCSSFSAVRPKDSHPATVSQLVLSDRVVALFFGQAMIAVSSNLVFYCCCAPRAVCCRVGGHHCSSLQAFHLSSW